MPTGRAELTMGVPDRTAELRHVAVLFADLQGFTHLCERLDPEEVVEILDGIFERLGAEAVQYGGHVDKVLGDGLMVLFGAPHAHEDDCLRGVMAGLAMLQAMSELQAWIRERLGQGLGLRVGVDAGPVVYGAIGPSGVATRTVIGDAANVAARLQRVAAPGQLVMSARVRRLVDSHIQTRRVGAVQLEGRQASVTAYVAVAPYAPLGHPPPGSGETLVGRSAELEALLAEYDRVLGGHSAVVAVTGERGIGKSRLLAEYAARLAALEPARQPLMIHVFNRWEVGRTYRPYDRLTEALGSRNGRLGRGTWRGPTPAPRPDGAVQPPGDSSASRTLNALAEVSDRLPLVLMVDDWDWADPNDTPGVASLIAGSSSMPVLFLLAGRRVDLAGLPQAQDFAVTYVRLQPLTAGESWHLLQQHPAASALPPDAITAIVQRSGGNPAHLLESVEYLIEEGALAASGEGWVVREEHTLQVVPEGLRNGVISQLDSLPPPAKELVRVCAILGEKVELPMLVEVTGWAAEDVGSAMEAAVDAGLLCAEPAMGQCRFRSDLVREVAYATMLRRQRRDLHRRAGLWLEQADRALVEDLALHFVRGEVPDRATLYGLEAGEALLRKGLPEKALALLTELDGLEPSADSETRAALLEKLAEAHVAQGDCQAGLERVQEALALTREPTLRARLMRHLGWAHALQGRADLAMRQYQQARTLLESTEGNEERALVAAYMRLLYDRP